MSTNTSAHAPKDPLLAPRRGELASVLFLDGDTGPDLHSRWCKAISTGLFRHRCELSVKERWQQSYERLRALNEEVHDVPDLVRDPRALAALHEWTSVVDGATATVAGIHYNLFLGSLLDDDVSPPRDLAEFAELAVNGTFLCTEHGHGNDAAALETVACYDRDRDEFVLHTPHEGAQKYMPNTSAAGGPKSAVVAARLVVDGRDEGVLLFLTPLSDRRGTLPGVTVAILPDRIGSPVDHCVTSFDHVRLPRTALLQGEHGRLTVEGTLTSAVGSARKRFLHAIRRVTVGKLCMSASTLGGSRAALAIAVRYAYLRRISGPVAGERVPLAAHRSHHARLLACTATAYAMTFLHRTVTERWITHGPEDREETERLVAMAKGWITWQARDITIESRERCGARALFPVNGLAEFPANADGAITAEGDNLAVWCKAGAEMIFGHAAAPEPQTATGQESLTDPAFLRRALAAAERHWHLTARRDIRNGTGDGLGRWNHASSAALALVETHTVGQAADAFAAACAQATDPSTRATLDDLHTLFLLERLAPLSGQLLADHIFTAEQVRSLPDTLRELTARLAPHLATLTAAFDVPEEHLASLPMLTSVNPAPA
ncbi:acyl-CoA oxidase [Streptomyces venezuelae]|uniref:Acyl-CoA oxidase n=1 Tax=Streptomyces venezuelae TaxID=54571 RepID=A0A5P2C822_STRVZ|nr:acyl-CoA dehydrogenase [Streptomyces venezuelae]QES38537.1 acyl-CoA oxidase [Streptomyces venezuelae]